MSSEILSEEMLQQVRPVDVQRYSETAGWQRAATAENFVVYHWPGSDTDELTVPQHPQYRDFARRMEEVVRNLSQRGGQSPEAILQLLLQPPADVLRFRLAGRDTAAGTLSLEQATTLLNGMRRTLLAAACDVLSPRPYHPRLSLNDAVTFVAACRLGQTERGSFTAKVISL